MVKKLTALLLCALFTGAVVAEQAADTMMKKEETKTSKRSRSRKNGNGNKTETVVATEDTYTQGGHRHGRYEGSSCSSGSCGVKRGGSCHSHACRESNCGVCSRKAIPNKPCCEKAVTVRTEPCLHKHVEYSWTCPVDYNETACPTC